MGNSLLDQLKKSGLVNEQQAKTAKKNKHKQSKKKKSKGEGGKSEHDESKQAVLDEQAKKVARDKALNRERELEQQKKAITSQIKQMVEDHAIARAPEGEIRFNFSDAGKVRRIYVDESQQSQLFQGKISVIKFDDQFHLVPTDIAKKIAQRDESALIYSNDESDKASEQVKKGDSSGNDDDPYSDFQIPDDLMW